MYDSKGLMKEIGFNEAGAIMPRSGPQRKEPMLRGAPASMRPGQSCPGVVSATTISVRLDRRLQ